MERFRNVFIIMLVMLLVIPMAGCRIYTDSQKNREQPVQTAQAEPQPAAQKAPTAAEDKQAKPVVRPAQSDPSGKRGTEPTPVRLAVRKAGGPQLMENDPANVYDDCWLYMFFADKGETILIPGFLIKNEQGKMVQAEATGPVLIFYSPAGVKIDALHFCRPNGTKYKGKYVQMVHISAKEHESDGKVFDVVDLGPMWDVISDPAKRTQFFMTGSSPSGDYLVKGKYVMVDPQTFRPQPVLDRKYNTEKKIWTTVFASANPNFIADPVMRMSNGEETWNIWPRYVR